MQNLELVYKKSRILAKALETICGNREETHSNVEHENNSIQKKDEIKQRWLEQRKYCPYQFIILFGMGTGKSIKNILEHMQEESILFVYEPYKENGQKILYNEEFIDILSDTRVQIVVEGMNEQEFSYFYGELMTDLYQNQLCIWQHPDYLQLSDQVIEKFQQHIQAGKEYHQVLNNSRQLFYKDYHQNIVHGVWNLKEVRRAEDLQSVISKDTFVVLVAAGPSLEKELQVLKDNREKIIIVAVYRVVGYLLANDITPDFITTIDFHQERAEVDSEIISGIPMILPETASLEVWDHHKGIKILGELESYCYDILNKCGVTMKSFRTQPSVAAWQLLIMAELGVERVALVGQDLAYQGEVSHVGGEKEKKNYAGEVVEGIDGTMLPSRGDWLIHKQAIETIIQSHPEMTVYDTKTCGAKISNAVYANLKDLIETYGNDNRKNVIRRVQEMPYLLNEEVVEVYNQELEKSKDTIKVMLQKANRMLFLTDKICKNKRMKPQEKHRITQEISDINVWMDEQKEMGLITLFVEAQTMDLADKLLTYNEDKETEEYNTYLYLQEYYKYIVVGLEEVETMIEGNMYGK